jgi:hypothetical protein
MTKQWASILFVCTGVAVGVAICTLHRSHAVAPIGNVPIVKLSMVTLPETSQAEANWTHVFLSGVDSLSQAAPNRLSSSTAPKSITVPKNPSLTQSPPDAWTPYVMLPTYPPKIIGRIAGRTGRVEPLPETTLPLPTGDLQQLVLSSR